MSKKSLDDLLKDKLAHQEFVFRDEYWADASAFIKSQQPIWKKFGFWRNAAFAGIAITAIGIASYFLLNKTANQSVTALSNAENTAFTEVNAPLVQEITVEKEISSTPPDLIIKNEESIKTQHTTISKSTKNLQSEKIDVKAVSAKKTASTESRKQIKTNQTINQASTSAYINRNSFQNIANQLSFESTEQNASLDDVLNQIETEAIKEVASEEVTSLENVGIDVNKLAFIQKLATQKRDTDYVSTRNMSISKSKWCIPASISVETYRHLKTYDFLSDSASVAQLRINGIAVSTQLNLNHRWQMNVGVAYDTRTFNWQNEQFEKQTEEISFVDNSYWTFNYQSIFTPGYKYSQGVAFHDTTETILTDSTFVQLVDTQKSLVTDTVYQTKQSFSANYFSIPIVMNYAIPFGRFNLLVGLGVRNSFMVKQQFKANPEFDFALVKAPKYSMNLMSNIGCEAILTEKLKLMAGIRFEQTITQGVQFEHGMTLKPATTLGYFGAVFCF